MADPEIFPLDRLTKNPETGGVLQRAIMTNYNDQMVVVTEGKTLVGRTDDDRGKSAAITVQTTAVVTRWCAR